MKSRETLGAAPGPAAQNQPDGSHARSLRALLMLGFGGVFLVGLFSVFVLAERMARTDSRGTEIREHFLGNSRLLQKITTLTLNSALDSDEGRLDVMPAGGAARDDVGRIREEVDRALDEYEPRDDGGAERLQWDQLRAELTAYWPVLMSERPLDRRSAAGGLRADASAELLARRQTIIRLLNQIHALNEEAFDQEQAALHRVRGGLRRQVWQAAAIAGILGLGIALAATRQAGRLERRIRDQHALETDQKRELERLSSKLMVAQEDERRRIARELHDEVGQALGAIKLELAVAEGRLDESRNACELAEARAITDRALQSVRELSHDLHPAILDDLGLPDAVSWYLRGFSRRTGIRTHLEIQPYAGRLRPDLELCLYRVIQEAVTNVGRHAGAASCRVNVVRYTDRILVTVTDDGRGFDPAAACHAPGLGLVSLRERVSGLGGRLDVQSGGGQGTSVIAELPLSVSAL